MIMVELLGSPDSPEPAETKRRARSSCKCRNDVEGLFQEGCMDVLVMLEESPDHSPVLAHVNSVPSPLASSERPSRDIVTLYGEPNPESLALALAAAVES